MHPRKKCGLLAIDTAFHDLLRLAISRCIQCFEFDHILIYSDRKDIISGADYIETPTFIDKDVYNDLILRATANATKCDHYLVVQYDGFVLDPKRWTSDFLTYDYIGAPWPNYEYHNVGNGGFSLRSQKLIETIFH